MEMLMQLWRLELELVGSETWPVRKENVVALSEQR